MKPIGRNYDNIRILISGTFGPQNYEFCWWKWLQIHDYPTHPFDPDSILERKYSSPLMRRLFWHFFQGLLVLPVSRRFVAIARSFRPDLVLVVNGRLISATALETIRQETKATLFHFYGEDFFNPLNTNKTLRESAYFYDHIFTTKTFNIPEMAEIGLKKVSFLPHGYIPECHFPVTINMEDRQEYGSDLAFVGTWEAERASMLSQLKEFDLRIWGAYWHKASKELELRKAIQNRSVYCDEMSRVFNASKINLAFLRKANRDLHTSRTFEIPACGGFQLSERTEEILNFFEEGKEIACFESVDELKDKARYYLQHDSERQNIALAGLARVKSSPYSDTDTLQRILEKYIEIRF
jgi:spore maturation protein CgeB